MKIAAVGGQSDGKSSLLEALLGFKFNVVASEIGTRRPLIVQMRHDPACPLPRCQLQAEGSAALGPPLAEAAVAGAIRERTEAHLAARGGAPVSPVPIVMHVAYAFCTNLTIIDTPGLIQSARKDEPAAMVAEIRAMVAEQAAPAHRIILFLQQSTVEWASSTWLKVVKEVDPDFRRTIFVATKLDHRLPQLTRRAELEAYLSAGGEAGYLPPRVRPFFVALPTRGAAAGGGAGAAEWRRAIADEDAKTRRHLREGVEGGFDEARFGARIGFGALRAFLEDEMARRYAKAAPATLALLRDRAAGAAARLERARGEALAAGDVAALRGAAARHALALAARVAAVMAGAGGTDPARFGLTTEGERAAAGPQGAWAGTPAGKALPPNAGVRLFGGGAFERALQEFKLAAAAVALPEAAMSRDRVANALLARCSRGEAAAGAAAAVAEELARDAARDALAPLLDAACARLAGLVRRAFDVAVRVEAEAAGAAAPTAKFAAWNAALHSAFAAFADGLEAGARARAEALLYTATGAFTAGALLEAALAAQGPSEGDGADGVDLRELTPPAPAPGRENDAPTPRHVGRGGGATSPMAMMGALGTQVVVEETPSPELQRTAQRAVVGLPLGARGAGAPGAGAPAKSPAGSEHAAVRGRAHRVFRAIVAGEVVARLAPAALKAAFLEPLSAPAALPAALVCVAARADAEFLALFRTPEALAALEEGVARLEREAAAAERMRGEFSALLDGLAAGA
jgi:hypothetical protein